MWYVLPCLLDGADKRTLAAKLKRVFHVVAAAGFLSRYLNGPLPHVRHHATIKLNMLSTLLSKIFPFLVYKTRKYNN